MCVFSFLCSVSGGRDGKERSKPYACSVLLGNLYVHKCIHFKLSRLELLLTLLFSEVVKHGITSLFFFPSLFRGFHGMYETIG